MIAIGLNLLLITLLVMALLHGRRLDIRLKAVREGQEQFARAVAELDIAATRARQGLDQIREMADESTDLLGSRVTRAREAAERLEKLIARAEAVPEPKAPEIAQEGLASLIAKLGGQPTPMAARQPFERRAARPARPSVDEDLFAEPGALA